MKFKLITSLGLVLAVNVPSVFAAANEQDNAALIKALEQITAQTKELQAEVKNLKAQVVELKQARHTSSGTSEPRPAQKRARAATRTTHTYRAKTAGRTQATTANQTVMAQNKTNAINAAEEPGFYSRGITVTTSPFLNYRSAYDASDLIVTMASMNQDLGLLQLLQKVEVQNAPQYQTYVDRPLLVFSGKVEANGYWQTSSDRTAVDSNDFNLASAELDILAKVSPWAYGFFTLNYDSSPFNARSRGVSPDSTVGNSRVFVKRGFLTIGDLNKFPFYLTAGQFYMPFGYYSSNMVSTPETQILGRTTSRGVQLGYNQYGLNVSLYTYNGDSSLGQSGINEAGANINYQFQPFSNVSVSLGGGYISTLTDADGAQNTGINQGFIGFAQAASHDAPFTFSNESLARRVPAMNLNAKVSFGSTFALIAEYVSATREYGMNSVPSAINGSGNPIGPMVPTYDISYDGHGARPSALHIEGQYFFDMPWFAWPSNMLLAYGNTSEALGYNLPQDSYTIALNTSVWKNTILGIEFRHDVNYPTTANATGLGSVDASGGYAPNFLNFGSGTNTNTFLMQLGIYF